jgi:hypothetical protein
MFGTRSQWPASSMPLLSGFRSWGASKRVGGLSTGDIADAAWLRFSFPTWWHYDVLRARWTTSAQPTTNPIPGSAKRSRSCDPGNSPRPLEREEMGCVAPAAA